MLTPLWATFWVVVYPLHQEWEGQERAQEEFAKMGKVCDALIVEKPEWDMTKNCYDRAWENYQNTLKFYSFKHFWAYPVVYWWVFLPLIVVPPAIVYALAALGVWIRSGFKARTSHQS